MLEFIDMKQVSKNSIPIREISETVFSWLRPMGLYTYTNNTISHWTKYEWQTASIVAFVHGIGPYLHTRLQEFTFDGILESFKRYLSGQYLLNRDRINSVIKVKMDLLSTMETQGIVLIPLKGGKLLQEYYDDPGHRPMADLDFLISSDHLEAGTQHLLRTGALITEDSPRHRAFTPKMYVDQVGSSDPGCPSPAQLDRIASAFGEHPDNPYFIEFHTHIAEEFWGTQIDITSLYGASVETDPEALLYHLLLHAGHNTLRSALRMIQLIDIMLVARDFSWRQWHTLMDWSDQMGALQFIYPPLCLAERYLGPIIPSQVLTRVRERTPTALVEEVRKKSLSHFSYCNPRQASIRQSLKWFQGGKGKFAALKAMARGLPKSKPSGLPSGRQMDGLTYGLFKRLLRVLDLLKKRVQRTPRKGWVCFQAMGISKDAF